MIIKARDVFGIELNDEALMLSFSSQFPILPDGDLTIDFSGCIIDYHATSSIMDIAIERLLSVPPPHHLIILFNVRFQPRLLLKWLFLGSAKLGLAEGTASDADIETKIRDGLLSMGIDLDLTIVGPDGTVSVTHSYGQ